MTAVIGPSGTEYQDGSQAVEMPRRVVGAGLELEEKFLNKLSHERADTGNWRCPDSAFHIPHSAFERV